LILLVLFAVVQAIVESALFELASFFPSPKYINGIQIGKEMSSLVMVLIRIGFTAANHPELHLSGEFTWAFIGLIIGLVYFFMMRQQTCFKYYTGFQYDESEEDLIMESDQTISLDKVTEQDNKPEKPSETPTTPTDPSHPDPLQISKWNFHNFLEIYKELAEPLWLPMLACATVVCVSWSLFPLISYIQTTNGELNQNGWFFMILMSIFSLFSLIGNLLLREKYFVKIPHRVINILVCVRLLFIPLWLMCMYTHIFRADVFPVTFMIFFGLTNGFCGTYMMMFGPTLFNSKKENASVAMGFSFVAGKALGSSLGCFVKLIN